MTYEPVNNASDDSSSSIPVAVVGSPSTNTELMLDILDSHISTKLIGALVGLTWRQSAPQGSVDAPLTAVLGQITSLEMRNRWHEDQTFKNIIKSSQALPAITPAQDTRTALMKIGGCFVQNPDGASYSHNDMGSIPSTGTVVNLIQQRFLDSVLAFCKDDLFGLGRAYGNDVTFPMWFKHFSSGSHGIGEAYHIGIFGKTGSGKTGLAKMLLAAYARHPSMGILVIDPQGEFSLEMSGKQVGSHNLDLVGILRERLKRNVVQLPISKIRLEDWNLLEELLVGSRFIDVELGIRGGTQRTAAFQVLMKWLKSNHQIGQLANKRCALASLKELHKNTHHIYSTTPSASRLKQTLDGFMKNGFDVFYNSYWRPVTALFEESSDKIGINEVVSRIVDPAIENKPLIVVDLSEQSGYQPWTDTLQNRVISHLAEAIVSESSKSLSDNSENANTLVVIDEAHRFVPSKGNFQPNDQANDLRSQLKRAVRETRKYGVGWMFISQTMQGLDMEILMQLRVMFLGYGLAFGLEFRRLRELAGGDEESMKLYRSFRDPQSAIDSKSKEFPFMALGPISPMPFAGKPMFFSAFKSAEFLDANVWEPLQEG